ncbi:sarcalumenin [Biomphalaria pfeifferi]|uniref:Sarcalumenin n=1 Tax=Biomphalaria pfeifferi TaxID=112525 RepID=A0AAD8FLK4_BIOPF|nr:sarcalumenin [Biomphalaria pfeifferi]
MKYPFDVNKAITWLGDTADLIFVFFDPIGQALCKRTLQLVEQLNEKHAERIKFYLSKADEAGHESDRQRVMMQIVQELCKRPGLNRTGFDMPTIYVPSLNLKGSRCANQIEEVCKEIEKTINQTIQNTLNSLERDCDQIYQLVEDKLRDDSLRSSRNMRARFQGFCYGLVGMIIPVLLLVTFLISSAHSTLNSLLGSNLMLTLDIYLGSLSSLWRSVPKDYTSYVIFFILGMALVMLLVAKYSSRTVPTLSRKQKKKLNEISDYVLSTVKNKKQTLYQEYLRQSVAEQDL